jgi:hypothetical protein
MSNMALARPSLWWSRYQPDFAHFASASLPVPFRFHTVQVGKHPAESLLLRKGGVPVRSLTRSVLSLAILISTAISPLASAQPIDVPKVINDALQSAGQVRKQRTITKTVKDCDLRCCGRRCDNECWRCKDKEVQEVEVFRAPLSATSVRIVRVLDLKYGKPVINALPEAIRQQTFSTRNCSNIQQTSSTTLSITVSTSNSISVAQALAIGETATANLGFSVAGIGTGGASVSVNRQFSLTTTDAQTQTNAYAVTENVNQVVLPKTELWGELRAIESNLSLPFVASVIVDGTVDANLDGYSQVSQVLSESQRTITTSGLLTVTAASDAKKAFYERPLTAADCTNQPPVNTELFAGGPRLLGVIKGATPTILDPEAGPYVSSLSSFERLNARWIADASDFMKAAGTDTASAPTANAADRSHLSEGDLLSTPNFAAGGMHQCQSETDIGHSCSVFDIGFNDCNEAAIKLRMKDCCPSTKLCSFDPATGKFTCRYGGTSIGFTVSYCIPF